MGFLNSLKRQKPIVKYGIFLIIVIIWYSLIYSPLKEKIAERKEAIERQEFRIAKMKRRLSRLSNVDEKIKIAEQQFKILKSRLVPGDTIQTVSTNIQDSFLKAASKEKISVLVYRSATPRRWRDYKLAVSIFNIRANIRQFVALLDQIYSSKRLQRLDNVSISSLQKKDSTELRINMEIEALFLGEKAEL